MSEDDSNAIEGTIARRMFCMDDDSSSDNDDAEDDCGTSAIALSIPRQEFIQYSIMDITLEEQTIGGSIAQRLWPAAEYLANFIMARFSSSSAFSPHTPLTIIELGAGVGLTGLQLATCFDCRVLLTDLPSAMPLLKRNIEVNRERFRRGEKAVHAQVLNWGDQDDAEAALQWVGSFADPFLIIASDCVYFPKLHEPLEQTLSHLLTGRTGSKCWIAGMRRWKSDNIFFKKLGKKTKTATHRLICECLEETVTRKDDYRREVIRVFAIESEERMESQMA